MCFTDVVPQLRGSVKIPLKNKKMHYYYYYYYYYLNTRKNTGKPMSGQPVFLLKFEHRTYRIQA
jgi:hypothetical protein